MRAILRSSALFVCFVMKQKMKILIRRCPVTLFPLLPILHRRNPELILKASDKAVGIQEARLHSYGLYGIKGVMKLNFGIGEPGQGQIMLGAVTCELLEGMAQIVAADIIFVRQLPDVDGEEKILVDFLLDRVNFLSEGFVGYGKIGSVAAVQVDQQILDPGGGQPFAVGIAALIFT